MLSQMYGEKHHPKGISERRNISTNKTDPLRKAIHTSTAGVVRIQVQSPHHAVILYKTQRLTVRLPNFSFSQINFISSTSHESHTHTNAMSRYVVVHVLTTCDEHGVYVTRDSTEIIELAWTVVQPGVEPTVHSSLVCPVNTPITSLCTQLTGISWEMVQNAGSLADAVAEFGKLATEGTVFVSLDSWDLRVQLPREARDKHVVLPPAVKHPRVFDLGREWLKYENACGRTSSTTHPALLQVCRSVEVDPPTSPRAGPAAFCVAKALQALVRRAPPKDYPSVLTRPLDVEADLRAFLVGGCKVLHLENLPADTTQSELESWFTQHGGRPIAFWTMRTPDQHKPTGFGFAMFASHDEAVEALALNGRALNDKVVEVSPSSEQVIERAQDLLTPFPPSKNRPRPGDWTCQSCGFSNFQRRTACFRCSYPLHGDPYHNHGHGANGGNGGHHRTSVPFRAGDWKCGKNGCAYHNFAKNVCCLKCGASRGEAAVVADGNFMRYGNSIGINGVGAGVGLGMNGMNGNVGMNMNGMNGMGGMGGVGVGNSINTHGHSQSNPNHMTGLGMGINGINYKVNGPVGSDYMAARDYQK